MTGRGRQPQTVQDALRSLADWLDEADRLINRLAETSGIGRRKIGDEVQQDMRRLADWFEANPSVSLAATLHLWDGPR